MTKKRKLWLDLETYSEVPITSGTHAYAAKAEIMLWAYAIDDGEVQCWDLTASNSMPSDLEEAFYSPDFKIIAHNGGMFDRVVMNHCGYTTPIERWYDTMVQAFAHSLPGSLDSLCEIYNLPQDQRKQKRGAYLVQLFCKPRPASFRLRRATRQTHPNDWRDFIEYAKADIRAMRILYSKMPQWNYSFSGGPEYELWCLDQIINYRGVEIDLELARCAVKAIDQEQLRLKREAKRLTNGVVESASQRDNLLDYIKGAFGIDLPNLKAATVDKYLDSADLPQALKELLLVRQDATFSSTAKYKKLLTATSEDSRLRGTLQFCGASRTGRWGGRLFQPQNLPRPKLDQERIESGIEALKADCADLLIDNVMELCSSALRGAIVAPYGKKLVVSDLSNIEGRMLAWLAGEEWKIKAFADFDNGIGHDLYKLTYARSFNVLPESVTKEQRMLGKVLELACGYGGGVGAFCTFAAGYRVDLADMAERVLPTLPDEIKKEAENFYDWLIEKDDYKYGLAKEVFIACDGLKRVWREAHPNIVQYWSELEKHAVRAIQEGKSQYNRHTFEYVHGWLKIQLPSGRWLSYPHAKIEGKCFSYMGVNQFTRKWERIVTYGGKLAENTTQGASRDIIACAVPKIEQQGYENVLSIHDEIIAEAPDTENYNVEHLSALLSANPDWAYGLPLAAQGFEAYRYKKD